ncbi:MAG: polysaccharide biosynthesis protein [Bacteroidales bacterium]|nr:polysaccharide biosynthesis protein [Bacteroidales bacterium]MDD4058595.1 polysaccharide biosynthesis protein [Bacteroidales bacterium]
MKIKDKIIVVTGGAGSFGKVIVNRLMELGAAEVRVFSRNSGNKWQGDIRDLFALKKALYGAHYIIHSAALKDVHYCESNPQEAIDINVNGTLNILNAAKEAEVEKVIIISTDKACFPMGTMGLTKALMEKMVLAECKKSSSPLCTIVRFGNLMGSAGTVIPLFVKQAKEGKSLTVTNPKMTRFMMTIEDAVNLTLVALEKGENGEIIVERAKSASIGLLAESAMLYSGVKSDTERNDRIKVTGARPGEKLFETMATAEEISKSTEISRNGKLYLKIAPLGDVINSQAEEYNSCNAQQLTPEEMVKIIQRLDSQV